MRDVGAGTTTLASAPDISTAAIGNGDSAWPSISGQRSNGQYYVAFTSAASNLGAGRTATASCDVFRRALDNGATVLVSRAPGGAAAAGESFGGGIDDSGTRVAFVSRATTSTPPTRAPSRAPMSATSQPARPSCSRARGSTGRTSTRGVGTPAVSGDGEDLCLERRRQRRPPGRRPGFSGNLFARDFHGATPTTELVARPAGSEPFLNAGAAAWLQPSVRTVSADGTRVAFTATRGGLLRQAFVRDTRTGALILASRADGPEGAPSPLEVRSATISADGRRVAFLTDAALDPADTADVTSAYVRDLVTGRTHLASRADGAAGADANAESTTRR